MFERRIVALPLLLALGALLFLPSLGAHSLWEEDEAHNARCVQEMAAADTWVTPTFNSRLRPDKPVLQYWAIRASYLALGASEWSARLPSALIACLTLALCYELGRALFDGKTGFVAAALLGASLLFNIAAHAVTPDAFLAATTLAAFAAFAADYRRGGSSWLITGSVASALAVLAKGPVGLVLPGGIVGLFLLWQRDLGRLWNWRLAAGAVLFAAIALPWYVLVGLETRFEFWRGFFLQHNLSRFGAAMEGHHGGVWFHPLALLVGFAPGSAFVLAAAYFAGKGEGPAPREHKPVWRAFLSPVHSADWAYRFLGVWCIAWIGFFSAAATKLPNYLLPMYPALAVIVGRFLVRWFGGELQLSNVLQQVGFASFAIVGACLGMAMVAASGVLPAMDLGGRAIPALLPLAPLGLVPVAGAWLARRWQRSRHGGWALGCIIAASVMTVGGLAAIGPLAAEKSRGVKVLAARLNAEPIEGDVTVGCHLRYHPSLLFYCDRMMKRSLSDDKAVDLLNSPWPAFLVVAEKDWPRLKPRVSPRCEALARAFEFKAGDHLLLVYNHGVRSFAEAPLRTAELHLEPPSAHHADHLIRAADPRQHCRAD